MGQITSIKKQTDNKFLNIYELENDYEIGRALCRERV